MKHLCIVPKAAAALVTVAVAASILAPSAHADGEGNASGADPFVGVWSHDAARVDCASGAVLARFKAMQMIHRGGTLSDTNSTPPTTRGPGFGVWERAGERRYDIKFRYARYFPDGNLDGYTVVSGRTLLAHDGNSVTNSSRVEIRDASDFLVATACASTTGTRLP
jgi:hypothetical protein